MSIHMIIVNVIYFLKNASHTLFRTLIGLNLLEICDFQSFSVNESVQKKVLGRMLLAFLFFPFVVNEQFWPSDGGFRATGAFSPI